MLFLKLQKNLVTFGIVPTHPETDYGYIKQDESQGNDCFNVAEFVEKPNEQVACEYGSA